MAAHGCAMVELQMTEADQNMSASHFAAQAVPPQPSEIIPTPPVMHSVHPAWKSTAPTTFPAVPVSSSLATA